MDKICVLGLGYIGLPTAVTLSLAGFFVVGVDVKRTLVDALTAGRLSIEEPGLSEAFREAKGTGRLAFSTDIAPADAFIITVQTPHKALPDGARAADLRFVEAAGRDIARVLKPGDHVVLESTVPPGACRRLERVLSEGSGLALEEFSVSHCPERVIPGRILRELRENDRVIGGRTDTAVRRSREIYERVVTTGRLHVTDDITAEMCKLVENTFRDINIAYANELSRVAHKLDIDVFRLIELANCHPRVKILSPGVGVGGHCIAVDPWFIHECFPDDTPLIAAARRVNDRQPAFIADVVLRSLPAGANICVLGLSYKPDVDDLRESPSLALCRVLRDRGVAVFACEPHVGDPEIEGFENISLDSALLRDFLVVTVGHTIFRQSKDAILRRPHYDCVGL